MVFLSNFKCIFTTMELRIFDPSRVGIQRNTGVSKLLRFNHKAVFQSLLFTPIFYIELPSLLVFVIALYFVFGVHHIQTGWVHIEGNAYLVIGTTHGAVVGGGICGMYTHGAVGVIQ